MKICLLTLYLNHFNENKIMFERTLKNFFFNFFCGIVKLICELRHIFFINLRLRQILILRSSAPFLKNLRCAAGIFAYSAVCGNTYATPHPPPPDFREFEKENRIFTKAFFNRKATLLPSQQKFY